MTTSISSRIASALLALAIIVTSQSAYALTMLEKTRDVNETISQENLDNPYYDSIQWGYEVGVFDGYKDGINAGKFLPDGQITRAEFLKMMFNVTKEPIGDEYNTNCFTDSSPDKWYNKYLCYSKVKKYLGGYADGTFHPNDNILVSEAHKILVNVFGIESNESQVSKVSDFIDTGKWYYEFVTVALSNGIRFSNNERPATESYEQKLTRGEMMNLLFQFYAVAVSKQVTSELLEGFKKKDASVIFPLLDKKSQDQVGDQQKLQTLLSKIPVYVSATKYQGGVFYNGMTYAYERDYRYVDSRNEKYDRKAVTSQYTLSFVLGSEDSDDTIKQNIVLATVLSKGKWQVHIEKDSQFYEATAYSDVSEDRKEPVLFGFLGMELCRNTKNTSCFNIWQELNSVKEVD
ncbi:MAG TPA: S-layer homology domain-containing protein [bacterium]|nr:S-layer homology domain-containing protein [bacterium]